MVVDASALVVVSVDGFSEALLEDRTLAIPTIRGLEERGLRAAVRPVFPSVTWPCHTTMVTGVRPAHHGVLGNHVYDRTSGQIVSHYGDRTAWPVRAETLAHRARAAGLRGGSRKSPATG